MTSNARSPSKDKKLVITVLISAVVLFIIFAGGISSLVFSVLKNSEPSQKALFNMQNNAQLVEELGEPIEFGFWALGSYQTSNSRSSANIRIPTCGPKGSGTVYIVGTSTDDIWTYDAMVFKFNDSGETVNLLSE